MNKTLLFLLLLCPHVYAENKPKEPEKIEIIDIDLNSEQSTSVDKLSTTEHPDVRIEKKTCRLKLKISVFAALGSFLTGTSALIWKYIKRA